MVPRVRAEDTPSSSRRMPGVTTTTQLSSLQGLREAGAGERPPPSTFFTHPVQQVASPWVPCFNLTAYYFAPRSILSRTPQSSALCAFHSAPPEKKDKPLPPTHLNPTLHHTTGDDWSYMEKLVMKAVLGSSTSKVASLDSLARLAILLVMTV